MRQKCFLVTKNKSFYPLKIIFLSLRESSLTQKKVTMLLMFIQQAD